MSVAEPISRCRVCSNTTLTALTTLGRIPVSVGCGSRAEREPRAIIGRVLCTTCGTLQTDHHVLPMRLFAEAHEFHQFTRGTQREARRLADELTERFPLRANDLVIDIGSNDGTLLRAFESHGLRGLGIEPSATRTSHALRRGVLTMLGQFGPVLGDYLSRRVGRARLIVSRHPLGILANVPAFLHTIASLLDADGAAVLQVRHASGIRDLLGSDMVHSLNPCAVSVNGIAEQARRCGLTLTDVELGPPQSATLFLTLQSQRGDAQTSDRVKLFLEHEASVGLNQPSAWMSFAEECRETCSAIHRMVTRYARDGLRVAGFSATADAVSFLHATSLGPKVLDRVLDPNPPAHGKWTSVGPVQVVSMEQASPKPDILVVLDRTLKTEAMRWAQEHSPTRVFVCHPHPHELPLARVATIAA